MTEGMLWFDNSDQRDLSAKIVRAAEYYNNKYGEWPTLCFVHPSALLNQKAPLDVMGIEVRETNSVLPNHFWLGTPNQDHKKR